MIDMWWERAKWIVGWLSMVTVALLLWAGITIAILRALQMT